MANISVKKTTNHISVKQTTNHISIKQTTPNISVKASGPQGPQGEKGDSGVTDYNELENLPDLTLKADKATTYTKTEVDTALTDSLSTKQDTLVSGTNIKTVNGSTLLGSGDIVIAGGSGAVDSVNAQTGIVVLDQDDVLDGTTYKQYSATEKTKLSGIAVGATANSSDATLLNRANHTGVQAISTILSLQGTLDSKAPASHTHTASQVTDFDTKVSNNTDVAANTAARHNHANSAVLDATTASFTAADETKLDGIEAGAQVNTVTSVNTRTGAVTGLAEASDLTAHTGNTSNPHSVTKAQVGLGNVSNLAPADMPVSTATQAALNTKASLSDAVKYRDILQPANSFGGRSIYISDIHDALFQAQKRFTVTAKKYNKSDDSFVGNVANYEIAALFDTSYDTTMNLSPGQYAIININFNKWWPSYGYGNIIFSEFIGRIADDISARVYVNYEPQGLGWHDLLPAKDYHNGGGNRVRTIYQSFHSISEIEIKYTGSDTTVAWLSRIEWQLDRPDTAQQEFPFVDKHTPNSLYYDLSMNNAKIRGVGLPSLVDDVATKGYVDTHSTNTNNPHGVTKAQVGLGNVDNTSDANKPVSTAQATANGLRVLKAGDTMTGNLLTSGDFETTTASKGVILKSPSGTRYRITVADGGTLTTTAL